MPQKQKCHQDIILPQTGRNPNTLAWYVPLLACSLLALPSLTHTLKNLPNTVPLLHVVFWSYGEQHHPYTQGFTRVMQSGSLQPGLSSQKRSNHQHHSTRANPHKNSQVKCIQNI